MVQLSGRSLLVANKIMYVCGRVCVGVSVCVGGCVWFICTCTEFG